MLYAFVDESERDEDYYFLGALVCTAPQLEFLNQTLDEVMGKHAETFPAIADAEFHGSAIMRANERPWRRIPLRARSALYIDALNVIAESGARIYIEGININRQRARYAYPKPARELAFSHLWERIESCGAEGDCQVRAVADQHHSSETSRSNFLAYQVHGTYGYKSSTLRHIDSDIEFVDSRLHRALQGADLVTYVFNRMMTITESDSRAVELKEEMWEAVRPATMWPRGKARVWP